MLNKEIVYNLPKPKTLNLQYLYFYILLFNLNYYIKLHKKKFLVIELTADKMNMTSRNIRRQMKKYNILFDSKEKMYYISNNHILQLNEGEIDSSLENFKY